MERVYSFKDLNDIKKYKDADAFLVETSFSAYQQFSRDDKELEYIISYLRDNHKKVYLRCDRILLEEEAMAIKQNISLFEKADGIFFEDFAFVTLFKKRNKNLKLVYFPFEGISSIEDANTLLKCGIDKVILPHGKEKLLKSGQHYENIGISCLYQDVLFMSRRKLLSLKDVDNTKVHLIKENTRDSKQNILETKAGTIIFDEIKRIDNIHEDVDILLYDLILIKE